MECFLGEIRAFTFNYAPQYWALCNGASIPVAQNQALYSLLVNMYGGNAQNFNLPDLRGRTPVDRAMPPVAGYEIGNIGGQEQVVLTVANLPAHSHGAIATAQGGGPNPTGQFFAASGINAAQGGPAAKQQNVYGPPSPLVSLSTDSVGQTGGNQAHNNMQPFSVLNFCISTAGYYPPRD